MNLRDLERLVRAGVVGLAILLPLAVTFSTTPVAAFAPHTSTVEFDRRSAGGTAEASIRTLTVQVFAP